jgi:hypothetical protein
MEAASNMGSLLAEGQGKERREERREGRGETNQVAVQGVGLGHILHDAHVRPTAEILLLDEDLV